MSRHATFLVLAAASLSLAGCSHHLMEPGELAEGEQAESYQATEGHTAVLIPELTTDAPATPSADPVPVTSTPTTSADMPALAEVEPMEEYEDLADDFDADFGAVEVAAPRDRERREVKASSSGSAMRASARVRGATRSKKDRRQDSYALDATALSGGASVASMSRPAPAGQAAYYMPPAEPVPEPEVVHSGNAEDYTDHGVNPFTIVNQDALSTFSIDVDTAAYSISRRKLEGGSLPPQASVRVEEFVNYFDYGYTEPSSGPFGVHMEAMPDPFRPGHHVLRVGVQGDEISRAERKPVHLTFLVDVSGSMSSGDKLPLAKESLHMLVDSLREDDSVGLCTYAGRVARVLEPTSAANKRAIHDAIEALNSGGSTAMSSGIDIAYEMAWETFEEGHENRVIVMSDGDANVGNTSWETMLANIKGYADRGVTVSTIGFGMGNYKDTLMEQLSNNGDGNNYYIDDRDQAQRVFVEGLGGTMVTIARDVKIQVEFNPESVYSYRLIGYENRDIADKDFRNDRVDAGEIGSGHNVTALYDVILRDGYARELATVRLRWEAPGADKAASEKAFRFSHTALKETSYLTSRATRIAYSAATFAEILRGSPHAAEISLERLAKFATQAARAGEKDDMELVELMRKADALGVQNVASVY